MSVQITCPFINWVIHPFYFYIYIFWIEVPYEIHDLQKFSPILILIFCFLGGVTWSTKDFFNCFYFYAFNQNPFCLLFILSFCFQFFLALCLKHCLTQSHRYMFCSKSFIVFAFRFMSMIQFELIFSHGMWGKNPNLVCLFFFFQHIFNPTITCWKTIIFLNWIFLTLLPKSIHHKCEVLFLDSQFYSDLYVYFYASTMFFEYSCCLVSFESEKCVFQICFCFVF